MKKIALIYPSVSLKDDYSTGKRYEEVMPPLWALALASYLKQAMPRVKVEIVDEQILGRKLFLEKLSTARYDLAGLSPVAHTYPRNLECARLLKKNGAMVVLGGHYAPTLGREILTNRGPGSDDHCVDAIVRFDGEKAFHELARGTAFESIKNLVYPAPGGGIRSNPVENLDLAALPPVDYSLVDLREYFKRQKPPAHSCLTLPFVSQRGCRLATGTGRCIFCSIQSNGPARAIPPGQAARQMAFLASRYGVGYIYEGSDDFIADPAWFKEFVSAASGLKLPVLHVFVRPSILDHANLTALKSVNARYLNLGIESLSDTVLANLNRRKCPVADVNIRGVKRALAEGLVPNLNLVLGLPGETRQTLSETFSALKALELPYDSCRRISLPTLAVFPGTVVWRRLLEKEPKYKGQDMLSYDESFADWVRHFCGASVEDIRAAKAVMEKYFAARMERLDPGK